MIIIWFEHQREWNPFQFGNLLESEAGNMTVLESLRSALRSLDRL